MLLRAFPNLEWLQRQASTRFANRKAADGTLLPNPGWPNVVMNTTATKILRNNILGPLSIFTNISGKSEVSVEKKRVSVTPEVIFITNPGQHYTLELNDKIATETFNIHFGERFVGSAIGTLNASSDQLLDDPGKTGRVGFYNRLIPAMAEFRRILEAIREDGNDELFLEEQLFQLLTLLHSEEKKIVLLGERIDALKSSTREEILRRLLVASDYLYSYYDSNPGLDELARVSCLSKFHFLRLFKAAYHKTPHQFITELRIKKAKELLQKSDSEVGSIAEKLGFDNQSSFSRLFYNKTGTYPSQFRAAS